MSRSSLCRGLLAALLLCGCGHGSAHSSGGSHSARSISSGGSHSSSTRSSSHGSSHSGHSSHGGGGAGAAGLADCLSVLCESSLCLLDAAEAADEEQRAEDGSQYLSPPDPILEAASPRDPMPPPPDALPTPPPPPQDGTPVAPASAPAPAPAPAPAAQAVLLAPPSAAPAANDLVSSINAAQDELAKDERVDFVNRFVPAADLKALSVRSDRDLVAELAGPRGAALQEQLRRCKSQGMQLDGDEALCADTTRPLHWHLEAKGWVIDGLLVPLPVEPATHKGAGPEP
ncbi:MAG: hypothetical protein JST54_35040 [Deltaproteobacteria bacterium]|nr:hypothetical protein [Deltaproteobacteria bacterium]